jgi:ankyrin repeat protein
MNGQLRVAEFLIHRGAEVNSSESPRGWTPLHQAAARGHKAVVELLLARGGNPNAIAAGEGAPLHQAVSRGYREVVRALIAGGADVNARGASGTRNSRIVQGSLVTEQELSPLHLAAGRGLTNMIALLLAAGAEVNATNSLLETPLHSAVIAGKSAVIVQLTRAGANLDAPSIFGQTPLHLAIHPGYWPRRTGIAELLLEAGANPDRPDSAGLTPLLLLLKQWASAQPYSSSLPILQALIRRKADVNVRFTGEDEPESALGMAIATRNVDLDVVRLLLQAGAQVNEPADAEGNYPLHRALWRRDKELVKLLLTHGARSDLKNKAGQTPRDLVESQEQARRGASRGIPVRIHPGIVSTLTTPEPPEATPEELLQLLENKSAPANESPEQPR